MLILLGLGINLRPLERREFSDWDKFLLDKLTTLFEMSIFQSSQINDIALTIFTCSIAFFIHCRNQFSPKSSKLKDYLSVMNSQMLQM